MGKKRSKPPIQTEKLSFKTSTRKLKWKRTHHLPPSSKNKKAKIFAVDRYRSLHLILKTIYILCSLYNFSTIIVIEKVEINKYKYEIMVTWKTFWTFQLKPLTSKTFTRQALCILPTIHNIMHFSFVIYKKILNLHYFIICCRNKSPITFNLNRRIKDGGGERGRLEEEEEKKAIHRAFATKKTNHIQQFSSLAL